MKYYLQTQAPAGNWVDNLGSDDIESLKGHASWLHEVKGQQVRIVERNDVVVVQS